ncbi:MAG: GldG family protein [Candidatus Aminicenantes bacterium]|nr:GldG family protein [Candidatus Aminicenantes bacterium]
MEKLKRNLNTIGLGLLFAALIINRIWPYQKIPTFIRLGLGVASLIAYVGFNLSLLRQSLTRKTFLYSSNLILIIVLVLGILVLINMIAARYHHRFDFTEAKIHSLSDQSISVIKNLKNDINIKCFFREGNYNRSRMENLLKIYAYHSKKIKYEFIDPDKNPGLVKRYDITMDGTTVFECGDKENRITTTTEEDITNAIIKVSREKKKTIYFLEGHGEASIEESDDNGLSYVKDELGKLGYEVKKLTLALEENFPTDCALLVIPGPKKDLLPNELETIEKYMKQGGRVFFMLDPEVAPGMKGFLQQYGIKLEDDLIVDTISRLLGGDYFMPVVSEYEYHDITKKFRYACFFPYARSIDIAEKKPDNLTLSILAKTSPNSWSERQLTERQVSFDKDKDKQGPIPLAVVGTMKIEEEKKEEPKKEGEGSENKEKSEPKAEAKKEARLAVFGDSDFATNRYFNLSGNGNLFLNTINWLTEEADLISIQPRTSSPRTIHLSPSQARLIFFVSVIILPLIVLVTGISVWLRRRSL